MHEELIIAGFGGQGVMLIGQLLAYTGLEEGKNVLWMPAYGPETRGGFANCTVMVSDGEIYSPVTMNPDSLIIMNLPSLDKFENSVKTGGLLVVNTSLVNRDVKRTDIQVVSVPATEIATDLGDVRAANMVALGAYLGARPTVSFEAVETILSKVFKGKEKIIPLNKSALEKGAQYAKQAN